MPATNALIHEFAIEGPPYYDEDGDQMLGFYYQFVDEDDVPVSGLVGPYRYKALVERAARKAFISKDF